ncbi:MAG: alpha/beta hydrolase [Bradyrhizobiaceae bacterium]|nr:MAG: alpha/beta hydrolase [Bradyrhizobiaceae bacterium]
MPFVILMFLPAVLILLALLTQLGTFVLGWIYPPKGRFVDVPGARLHIVDIGPSAPGELPIVMIAGANSSLETLRRPLGDLLAAKHRVILVDRPGQGWSTRERLEDSTPAIHARMIDQALGKLGIARAIFVGHSWAGAVLPALALENPQRVAGLVMISPVTHPWRGPIGTLTDVATTPVIGPLMAYTVIMPAGLFMLEGGMQFAFYPQSPPRNFTRDTQGPLILRPQTFLNNAWDLKTLKKAMIKQFPDYGKIRAPVVVIAGDADLVVSTQVHAQAFAKAVPRAKLMVLPGIGHMPQVDNPKLVIGEIEAMIARAQAVQHSSAAAD